MKGRMSLSRLLGLNAAFFVLTEVAGALTPPPVTSGEAAPGQRVKVTAPEYLGTNVYHSVYLPVNWHSGGKYPVIVEYAPNYTSSFAGTVEDTHLGFYQSGGSDCIWVTMPTINYQAIPMSNSIYWWGTYDLSNDAFGQAKSAEYLKTNLVRIMEKYGGDPSSVFITGFSRGAIATGYIGLSSDELADIWLAFMPHSHHDGGSWTPDNSLTRTSRVKGRASFITYGQYDGGASNSLIGFNNLTSLNFPVVSYELKFYSHTDEWITDINTPAASSASSLANVTDVRSALRAWMQNVITTKPGTHSVSGSVVVEYGLPIAGARVQSGTHWTFSDQNGQYLLPGLIDGNRTLKISNPDHAFGNASVALSLSGSNFPNLNFSAVPFKITRLTRNVSGQVTLDFVGPPNSTFELRESHDLSTAIFPVVVTAMNAPLVTSASGIGQAVVSAADVTSDPVFFQIGLAQ
jgi:hypothetical protein